MLIDIAFLILLLTAIYKGYSKGLIVALFSLLAFVIGMLAAVKFSAVVATWLGTQLGSSGQWVPLVSFSIVFIAVVFLVRLTANLLQKTVQFAMLGWVNRLGGIAFYGVLYLLLFSVILFYTTQLNITSTTAINQSKCYGFVAPFGPKVINSIGTVIPIFKNLFAELQSFFNNITIPSPKA